MSAHYATKSPTTLAKFRFPDPEAASREISDLLEDAFRPSDPETAMILDLLNEEELSAREMAALFGLSTSETKPTIWRRKSRPLSERQAACRARSPDIWRVSWRACPEGQSCDG